MKLATPNKLRQKVNGLSRPCHKYHVGSHSSENSHALIGWLPRRGIQSGSTTLETEALRDIGLERK